MIIDHDNKIVFCKSRKTAGSSIQIALSKVLPNAMVIGSVCNDGIIDESNTAGRFRELCPPNLNHPHTPLNTIRKALTDPDSYQYITWVRNPYEIVVSRYKWDLKKAGREHEVSYEGFRKWVPQYCANGGTWWQDVQYPYYSIDQD